MDKDKLLELLKAVWAAGFRTGRDKGMDYASAYECGNRTDAPQDAETAWRDEVQWMLDTEESQHLDPENPAGWKNIP